MPYIKPVIRLAIIFSSLVLAACSSNTSKKIDSLEQDTLSVQAFDFKRAQQRPYTAKELGDNPHANLPVSESARQEFRFAVEALRGGNQDLAEQQLREMLEKYPELSGPAYNMAALKKEQGDIEQAEYYLQVALERNPHNFDALNMQAHMLREEGKFDQAEQIYQQIINAWGGYAPVYRNMGVLYDLYMGRVEEALVYYRQYNFMLNEPDPQVHGWIMDTERRLGVAHISLEDLAKESLADDSNAEEQEELGNENP